MTSGNAAPPNRITHDHKWQTLIEFTLASDSGSVHLATDLVVGAVQTLSWSAAHLEQLKLALAKAIQNALERNLLNDSGVSLIIRVFISEGGEATQETGRAGYEPTEPRLTDRQVQRVDRLTARGWGFFLVQKQGDTPPAEAGQTHHSIELFLYQERPRRRKYRRSKNV